MIAQKLPQLQPCFVQLGLAVANRAIEKGSDFIVLKPFYIMKHKDEPVAGRQIPDGALQRQTIDGSGQNDIASAKAASGSLVWSWLHDLIQRIQLQFPFA
jgi:hypothetical protein